MSAGSVTRGLRDRPIAEHERRAAFTVVAVVVIAATLLAVTVPNASPRHAATAPGQPIHGREAPNAMGGSLASTAAAERAARLFLRGYLGYIYGRSRAEEVRGAAPDFARSLPGRAPRVPPSMPARHPRVVALGVVKAPADVVAVTAVINDGGLVDYPIALRLAYYDSRLLVSGLGGP